MGALEQGTTETFFCSLMILNTLDVLFPRVRDTKKIKEKKHCCGKKIGPAKVVLLSFILFKNQTLALYYRAGEFFLSPWMNCSVGTHSLPVEYGEKWDVMVFTLYLSDPITPFVKGGSSCRVYITYCYSPHSLQFVLQVCKYRPVEVTYPSLRCKLCCI